MITFALMLNAVNVSVVPQTLVTAGSVYTENTVTVLLEILVVLAISMQIARGYFLRILRKFTLRLAADIWWLLFILLRDASIFLIVFLGVSLFWPGTYQDYPIAVPWQLLAVDFFAIALVIMLIKDTDESPTWNSALTVLVAIGSFLYIVGTVLVTESALALTTLPPTVSASTNNIWGFFNTYFNSINNPTLAIYSFYVCFTILLVAGAVAIGASFRGGIAKRTLAVAPKPVVKQPQAPAQSSAQQQQKK